MELIGDLVWASELFADARMEGFGWFFFRGPDRNVYVMQQDSRTASWLGQHSGDRGESLLSEQRAVEEADDAVLVLVRARLEAAGVVGLRDLPERLRGAAAR